TPRGPAKGPRRKAKSAIAPRRARARAASAPLPQSDRAHEVPGYQRRSLALNFLAVTLHAWLHMVEHRSAGLGPRLSTAVAPVWLTPTKGDPECAFCS